MLTVNPKTNDAERCITFHVDMDSFFASMDVRERPELKGPPDVLGSDPKRGSLQGSYDYVIADWTQTIKNI